MSRAVYEVLPMGSEWMVRMASDSEWEMHPTMGEAIRRARELGQRYSEWRLRVTSTFTKPRRASRSFADPARGEMRSIV